MEGNKTEDIVWGPGEKKEAIIRCLKCTVFTIIMGLIVGINWKAMYKYDKARIEQNVTRNTTCSCMDSNTTCSCVDNFIHNTNK